MKKKHGKEKFFLKFEWLLDKLTLPTILKTQLHTLAG